MSPCLLIHGRVTWPRGRVSTADDVSSSVEKEGANLSQCHSRHGDSSITGNVLNSGQVSQAGIRGPNRPSFICECS